MPEKSALSLNHFVRVKMLYFCPVNKWFQTQNWVLYRKRLSLAFISIFPIFLLITPTNTKKTLQTFWSTTFIDDQQLQSALREFDFLHHVDRSSSFVPTTPVPNRGSTTPTSEPMHQQRPHIRISPDTYHRPLLSMPPVILMGPSGNGCIPVSPIVEMPPSPAPSEMMFVEFPDDDDCVEVRIESFFYNFYFGEPFCCFFYLTFDSFSYALYKEENPFFCV